MNKWGVLVDSDVYQPSLLEHPKLELDIFESRSQLLSKASSSIQGLIVRTVIKVDSEVLNAFPNLQCVGSASAGFDHLDVVRLEQRGISWSAVPGCNANAVADYVIQSMRFIWGEKVFEKSVGIVGVGAVGACLQKRLQCLGHRVVAYDPPRERREEKFHSASLEELLQTDICTLHIPLSEENTHWLDARKLKQSRWRAVINAARGGVADEQALLGWKNENEDRKLILDVWEGEPVPNCALLRAATICTPHIAGYSEPAKLRATLGIRSFLSQTLDLSEEWVKERESVKLQNKNPEVAFDELTQVMKSFIGDEASERGQRFRALRKSVPFRAELPNGLN